jgi:hypothetical protein
MTMVLTTEVPSLVAVEHGRFRRISYVPGDVEFVSRVRVVRRLRQRDGSFEAERVEVEVFVPEDRRRSVETPRSNWIDGEYLRCKALVAKNRKTLRPFLESGEFELRTDAD